MKTIIISLVFLLSLSLSEASSKTWIVTSNADAGANSLRDMLARAEDGDNIKFALPAGKEIISLNSDLMVQDKSVIIDGSNAEQGSGYPVTVQVLNPGQSPFRVFTLNPGFRRLVTLMNMTLRGGDVSESSTLPDGGVILLELDGALMLSRCIIRDGRARNGGGIYSGGEFNRGSLVIRDCDITQNAAASEMGEACGGGIYVCFGVTILNSSRIYENTSQTHSGGFYIFNATGRINNSSIYGNTVKEGAANEGTFCGPSLSISESFITNIRSSTIAEKYPSPAHSRSNLKKPYSGSPPAVKAVNRNPVREIPMTLANLMLSSLQP
ncbi:MAG: hypothetical protein WBQ23_13615 [Bacteroidota bacterium]